MPVPASAAALAEGVLLGRVPDVARAISWAESADARFPELLAALFPKTGRARVTGLTGSPGAGKSTLTAALARRARARGRKVGIVAVDPSSPFSGGAILGDRIRMQDLALDPGVYMRSMAGRGALGGLAPAIADVVAVMDAFGFDYVLIETIGAGQDEVEIAGTAMTTILVNNPGTGDDIQALKAGIIEIADILVVNKADHPGADVLVSQLQALLALSPAGSRRPPILKTTATRGEGLDALATAVDEHFAGLISSGEIQRHREDEARHQVLSITRQIILERIRSATSDADLEALVKRVAAREVDPHTAAEDLAATVLI